VAAAEQGRAGRVYNFGGDAERTNLVVVRSILRALGKPEDRIEHVQDRKGHDRRYAIELARSETELGWRPSVTFERGLADTVRWYLENEGWWRRVKSGEYWAYHREQYGR
jgi:dTDP-glucose 4,6-dehydratase